jgi:multiple sugar transport system substrate-binding protein
MKGNFQIIILVVFIAAAILGVLVFSGAIPIGKTGAGSLGTVVLWGTVPAQVMNAPITAFNTANTEFTIKYEEHSPDTFNQDLLEALADGTGPDLFFLPDNLTYQYSNRIFTIPFSSYPLANFENTFAGAGNVFLNDKGIMAFPMTIDPLMMYYNRSILDANGIVYPPATWDDLASLAPTLTQKDNTNTITESAVALGDFSNVTNAKDILATLFMQTGNPIVKEIGGIFNSTLGSSIQTYNLPATLQFYTNFENPNNSTYSWNKSFSNSTDIFSAGNLAFYFGFASELQSLVNTNPNEDFFVAGVPQIKGSSTKLTVGHVTGLAISAFSKNFDAAFKAASLMSTGTFASDFATATNIPPARRDLLAIKPADAYSPIFYDSALYARSWLDPSPTDTSNIFSAMVNAVLSNSAPALQAIEDADSKLNLLLLKNSSNNSASNSVPSIAP